ncbi:MAG: hypothetical protein Q4D96_10995 [Propionibacteriaceae bacterium]|nr:hypothetical protein [Propionibacteriaceae bacterium]
MSKQQQFQWGRSRFGGVPTMRIAIPAGVAIGLGYGLVDKMAESQNDPLWWVAGLIFGMFISPFAVALIATLIVDRSTMEGAERNPEASIESTWLNKAASDGFYATLGACGVGAIAARWLNHDAISNAFSGGAVFMVACFGISYLIQKLRG